jgi:hypothetical protein
MRLSAAAMRAGMPTVSGVLVAKITSAPRSLTVTSVASSANFKNRHMRSNGRWWLA